MNLAFSVYLEICRIFATLLVFISHSGGIYTPLAQSLETVKPGRDGVIVFFILSGFVISWCADKRDKSFSVFAVNRASRIYSVALPGIFLGIASGLAVALSLDEPLPYQLKKLWLYLPMYLSFTGNFWSLNEAPPNNFPYWSLDFEVWYYIIFSIFFYISSKWKWVLLIIVLFLVGPDIVLMFPLWVAGSVLYFASSKFTMPHVTARFGLAATITILALLKYYQIDNLLDSFNAYLPYPEWLTSPRQLLGDWLLGIIVVLNFIFALNSKFVFSDRFSSYVHKIASYSFSFYLYHTPLFDATKILNINHYSFSSYVAILFSVSLCIVILARYTEHKKGVYRAYFTKVTNIVKGTLRVRQAGI